MDPAPPQTEQVTFNPLKLQRKEARATVRRLAELRGLRIDSIQERPRRFTVDIQVTVTGDSDDIASFCKAAGGVPGRDAPRRNLRWWIGAIIDGVFTNWAGR